MANEEKNLPHKAIMLSREGERTHLSLDIHAKIGVAGLTLDALKLKFDTDNVSDRQEALAVGQFANGFQGTIGFAQTRMVVIPNRPTDQFQIRTFAESRQTATRFSAVVANLGIETEQLTSDDQTRIEITGGRGFQTQIVIGDTVIRK